jgi:hypothetical protein
MGKTERRRPLRTGWRGGLQDVLAAPIVGLGWLLMMAGSLVYVVFAIGVTVGGLALLLWVLKTLWVAV